MRDWKTAFKALGFALLTVNLLIATIFFWFAFVPGLMGVK